MFVNQSFQNQTDNHNPSLSNRSSAFMSSHGQSLSAQSKAGIPLTTLIADQREELFLEAVVKEEQDQDNEQSEDEEEQTLNAKNQCMPLEDINLRQINRDIKAFLADKSQSVMTFAPMPKVARKRIHEIATCYQLKSDSAGKGGERHCRLVKKPSSRVPANFKRLDMLVNAPLHHDHQKGLLTSAKALAKQAYKERKANAKKANAKTISSITSNKCSEKFVIPSEDESNNNRDKNNKGNTRVNAQGTSSKVIGKGKETAGYQEGALVGAEAGPIQEDNVGNQLLRRLGWQPGTALGNGDQSPGIIDPLHAVYKANKRGLGSQH